MRQVGYYRQAAEILGFVEDGTFDVSILGREYLRTSPSSNEEAALLTEAISHAERLGPLRDVVLGRREVDEDALVKIAVRETGLADDTARHRIRGLLRWRDQLESRSDGRAGGSDTAAETRPSEEQLDLLARADIVSIDERRWPDPSRVPHNWPRSNRSVESVVMPDLDASTEVLIVAGYSSLDELIGHLGSMPSSQPHRIRIVFGNEPFESRRSVHSGRNQTLEREVSDYWLRRGISLKLSAALLRTVSMLERGRVTTRIAGRNPGQHAKIYVSDAAVTVGSSNFTGPGLRRQMEANLRIPTGGKTKKLASEATGLAEIYWDLAKPFDVALTNLLRQLLREVDWEEALARACAELLEGEWARGHLRDELGMSENLWPAQLQGIAQALWVLMNVGSVLVADATGSGKTRAGAWLLRALKERLVAHGRPASPPVMICPPSVQDNWRDEFALAEVGGTPYSHGAISNRGSSDHERVSGAIQRTRVLAIDEAHNFHNRSSNRSLGILSTLADHVVLFTATPINRDVGDLASIASLLGPDNLDDETYRIMNETVWRNRRQLEAGDKEALKLAVSKFTVRRTKEMFNALIDREPDAYKNRQHQQCRYPKHDAKVYRCGETKRDCELAGEIKRLTDTLSGVLMLTKALKPTEIQRQMGWNEASYVKFRLRSARALARYNVRASLRSSRAALWEHLYGTDAALTKYGLGKFRKEPSGNVVGRVRDIKASGPCEQPLADMLPSWLLDADEFRAQCDVELELYSKIGDLCDGISDARERTKAKLLSGLLDRHGLVVAFDSRPISLAVAQRELSERHARTAQLATGEDKGGRRRIRDSFSLGSDVREVVALCSDSMAEGVNLQQASAVVHLDMPSVIRIAEQRVGRIDRMDSPHPSVEAWWPKDSPEFAVTADEKLADRAQLVHELLGSNLELPSEADEQRVVTPEQLLEELDQASRARDSALEDAFSPVRGLVEGPNSLVSSAVYDVIRHTKVPVLAAVSVVRASSAWGFFAFSGTQRSAPRWVFVRLEGTLLTALDEVVAELRINLRSPESVPLDDAAGETMGKLLDRVERGAAELLPRRKRRALEQVEEVLEAYSTVKGIDDRRAGVVADLQELLDPRSGVDLDAYAEAWLGIIRRRWRDAMDRDRRRRRRHLRRLCDLTPDLVDRPLDDAALERLLDAVPDARPLSERVVAAIVGVC